VYAAIKPIPIRLEEDRMQSDTYHDGSRYLQDQFATRRLADRLEEVTIHSAFSEGDRAFITGSSMFFLATADASGRPECSYKGGRPGFVQVVDDQTIAFPDYDGNGTFRSLGNIRVNPHVGLLFIDFQQPDRMRLNGTATIHDDDPLLADLDGAQLIVRVHAEQIFPNCPRYIHRMEVVEESVYAPRPDYEPPEPEWKAYDEFRDVVPRPAPDPDAV
jgi:predicted pyridoxine 5'-phosphate oxidase superfamily flavin-nucleotide-binding protein